MYERHDMQSARDCLFFGRSTSCIHLKTGQFLFLYIEESSLVVLFFIRIRYARAYSMIVLF